MLVPFLGILAAVIGYLVFPINSQAQDHATTAKHGQVQHFQVIILLSIMLIVLRLPLVA